ncbi:MAG: lipoyl(octanoyl) transferase LipB [Bacteroidota bacterium]|nr:lipoyl(octanoyl) transferase LipB [Bacteroidota bacterium]
MNSLPDKQYIALSTYDHIPYSDAWKIQEDLFNNKVQSKIHNRTAAILEPISHDLILCTHPHVYTLGKSGLMKHLLLNNETLKQYDIEFFNTNRGGDITYHGPGQIVGYPILDLDQYYTDIGRYLRDLEEIIIRTIAHYNIIGARIPGLTGVWLDIDSDNPRKICAMGIRASRWITMHGFALNVNTDLSFFNHIVPCGITDKGVTSIEKETKKSVDEKEVQALIIKYFEEVFDSKVG